MLQVHCKLLSDIIVISAYAFSQLIFFFFFFWKHAALDENGHLKISHHATCSYFSEEADDIVGMVSPAQVSCEYSEKTNIPIHF